MQHNGFLWWLVLVVIYLLGIFIFRRFSFIALTYLFYTNNGLNPDASTLWRSIKHAKNHTYTTNNILISKNGLLEAISAAFFALSLVFLFLHYKISIQFVANSLFIVFLVLLACIDRHSFLLPDALIMPLVILGVMQAIIFPFGGDIYTAFFGFLTGYLILYVLNFVWFYLYGLNGFGAGDLKMLGAVGVWLGASAIPLVLCLACIFNAAFAMIKQCSLRPKGCYPFGPFIAIGAIVTLIYSKYVLI